MIGMVIDIETDSLDHDSANIIEYAHVQWDFDNDQPVSCYSTLVFPEDFNGLPENVVRLTGITDGMIRSSGINIDDVIHQFTELSESCHAVIGHNITNFDLPVLASVSDGLLSYPWNNTIIDTAYDVPYPPEVQYTNLTYLCGFYNVINTFSHRALADCFATVEILRNFDINEVERIAKTRFVDVIAKVSFDDRDKAKSARFRWDPEARVWFKQIKEGMVEHEKHNWDFEFEIQKELT